MIKKFNHAKTRAHLACLEFSCLATLRYVIVLLSVKVSKPIDVLKLLLSSWHGPVNYHLDFVWLSCDLPLLCDVAEEGNRMTVKLLFSPLTAYTPAVVGTTHRRQICVLKEIKIRMPFKYMKKTPVEVVPSNVIYQGLEDSRMTQMSVKWGFPFISILFTH